MNEARAKTVMSGFAKRRRVLLLLLLIVIIASLAYFLFFRPQEEQGVVKASGTIEAEEMDISPKIAGRITRLLVDEGDRVKKGEVIAYLDNEELRAQVEQARGNLATAEAQLQDLLVGTREERIREARANYQQAVASAEGARDIYQTAFEAYNKSSELRARVASSEAAYNAALKEREAAQARLTLVRKGPREEEIQQLRANLEQARAQLRRLEQDYVRFEKLYRQGAISGQQYDAALSARNSQRAAVEAAEARYREALAGSRPEEIEEAEARLAQAEANIIGTRQTLQAIRQQYTDRLEARQQMETARTNYETARERVQAAKAELDLLVKGATTEAIEAARGQVEQAKANLEAAQVRLSYTRVVAPTDGVVTDKFRELGEFLAIGTPIVRITDLDRTWLRVYAPLPALGKIKVGDSADITTDTYKDKVYRGRVSSISDVPEFTPKNVQTEEERVKLVYSVRIDVDNKSRELKPGMPADARIRINQIAR